MADGQVVRFINPKNERCKLVPYRHYKPVQRHYSTTTTTIATLAAAACTRRCKGTMRPKAHDRKPIECGGKSSVVCGFTAWRCESKRCCIDPHGVVTSPLERPEHDVSWRNSRDDGDDREDSDGSDHGGDGGDNGDGGDVKEENKSTTNCYLIAAKRWAEPMVIGI
jgi:hypothetical protein